MSVLHIGHINIRVLDMAAALNHYVNVLGLIRMDEDEQRNVYLKGWDEWDKYSVILTQTDKAGMDHIAYKVSSDADLDHYAKRVRDYGREVEELPAGSLRDCGRSLRFTLPSGHVMCLYAEKALVGKAVGDKNPAPWPLDNKGAGVHWLDHALLVSPFNPEEGINTVAENCDFMTQCLDFRLTEQLVVGPDQDIQALAFLTCTNTPHDIAFAPGPEAGLHHASFFLGWLGRCAQGSGCHGYEQSQDGYNPEPSRYHAW